MSVILSQAQLPAVQANCHLETAFKPVSMDFYNLHKITGSNRYSSSIFKNGKRRSATCTGFGNLIIYDIDNDTDNILDLPAAVEIFEKIQSLIITTKSHQQEKNGTVADRFRIILSLDNPMSISVDEYSRFYIHCAESLGIDKYIDRACKDAARMYQPNPDQQVHYTQSERVISEKQLRISFEEKKFLDHSTRCAPTRDVEADYSGSKREYLRSICFSHKFLDLMKYDEKFFQGNRNNFLYSVGRYLKDNYFSDVEIRETLMWMNSLSCSLKEAELNNTIIRSLKI